MLDSSLCQKYPNPFKNSTAISFTRDRAQDVNLEIINVKGQKVMLLHDGFIPEESHIHFGNEDVPISKYADNAFQVV